MTPTPKPGDGLAKLLLELDAEIESVGHIYMSLRDRITDLHRRRLAVLKAIERLVRQSK